MLSELTALSLLEDYRLENRLRAGTLCLDMAIARTEAGGW